MLIGDKNDHYFVDEAGDLTLFDRRGRQIVGTPGVSEFFMLGVLRLHDPGDCGRQLAELRKNLQSDPYFRGVPSMQPSARKTALCFHAKDDLPEVRREVFRVLSGLVCSVHVAIRNKQSLALHAAEMFVKTGKKIQANEIYDDLVGHAFHLIRREHQATLTAFARRGKRDRVEALAGAIPHSDEITGASYAAYPHECAGLEIVDYFLWALQRAFERKEERFYQLLAPAYHRIVYMSGLNDIGTVFDVANPFDVKKINT